MSDTPSPDLLYVAFDPGHNTGIAAWCDPTENPIVFGHEADFQGVIHFLSKLELQMNLPVVIVIEEYRVWDDKKGSKELTIQVIGAIKGWCLKHEIPLVEQRPTVRRTASAWSGVPWPKGHMPDWMSAFLHGYYYLHKNKLDKRSRVLEERRPLGASIVENEPRE